MRAIDQNFDFDAFINAPQTRAFVGRNYDHYKKLWEIDYIKVNRNPQRMMRMHWNWLAIFLVPAWLGYRKMYMHVAVWIGVIALLTFLEAFYHWHLSGGFTGANLVFALLSKSLYFHHARNFFEKNAHRGAGDLDVLIREKGGTSVPQAIVFTIVGLGAIYLATVAGETFGVPTMAIDLDGANVPV